MPPSTLCDEKRDADTDADGLGDEDALALADTLDDDVSLEL